MEEWKDKKFQGKIEEGKGGSLRERWMSGKIGVYGKVQREERQELNGKWRNGKTEEFQGKAKELEREEFKEKMVVWKDMEFKGKDGGVERQGSCKGKTKDWKDRGL